MAWESRFLDMVLVPLGILLLAVYHAYLWYMVKFNPEKTVIGVNHLNRQSWVRNIMSDSEKNGVLAVQTLRNSIMASTLLASTAITLSSIIGALVSSTSGGTSRTLTHFVYGETGNITSTLKYLCLLLCFLFSFVCHVQSIRYASHASFLLSIPVGDNSPGLTPEYVNEFIFRSQNFFTLGLRGYYFSFPLLLWIFGPIPMFVCSIVMIFLLQSLDMAKEFNVTFKIVQKKEARNENDTELHQILTP
ncbi:uncharacterized protein [Physcomitrium patens]|uniref:DUF599 domain-containing protein n=2 Tax=Physcomitrium patens TaxID=3218 RepID=A9TRU4_PHYPA|nr:uncharacterized protein LOC112296107 [Physcomitrium patens]PNR33874.1 hypothetical protein PHYPA_023690 [Physcomitrium patens]|eukprot:XP_024404047.1 uncharacterized protein LOC112296107 [Physcomitrella patens]